MIKLRVYELLEKEGKSKYWLYKQLNMSYQSFRRMIDNAVKSISRENIEALCQIFQCTPADIVEFTDEDIVPRKEEPGGKDEEKRPGRSRPGRFCVSLAAASYKCEARARPYAPRRRRKSPASRKSPSPAPGRPA